LNSRIDADETNLSDFNNPNSQPSLYTNNHTLFEASLRFFFPPATENNALFMNFGYGWNYDIIKNILSPGILFDISIGIDWFWLFSDDKDENDTREHNQFGLGAGFKIYNMIDLSEFMLIPFIGYNFLLFYKVCPMFGFSLSFKNFGLEYAYYFPLENYKPEINHHVSIKVMLKDN
jgi:hypothetical protein